MGIKICIDAGHFGKYNRSPAVKEYYESDMAWKLHLMQKKYLEEYEGVTVITTRQNQATDKPLYDRGAFSKGCDLFLSDHSNAVGNGVNEAVDYVAVYHLTDDNTTRIDDISKEIAQRLAPVIATTMGVSQGGRVLTRKSEKDHNGDGQLNDNYYGVLHGARMVNTPGLIIEHSFHTNTRAAKWLMDDKNLDKLAKAEAEVLANYFGLKKKGAAKEAMSSTSSEVASGTLIMGEATATAEQMAAYIKRKNPAVAQTVLDMIPLYLSEGAAEGVKGDIAFAQSCLETGNFGFAGSAVTLDQNNFCGMGVTSNGEKGNSFGTPQLGIRAQIQHLKAYASTEALNRDCIDPRFQYVKRGCAEYVEWLGQKENPDGKGWAAGSGYGGKILTILNGIKIQNAVVTGIDLAQPGGDFSPVVKESPFLVRVKKPYLNIRKGPGTDCNKTGRYTGVGTFTIVAVRNGEGSNSGWGLLKSYAEDEDGWIALDFVERV